MKPELSPTTSSPGAYSEGASEVYPLSEGERMLLQMRDTLYEGNWDDFLHDLQARAADQPHVFVTVRTSPHMKATIRQHIEQIEAMRRWETQRGRPLSA